VPIFPYECPTCFRLEERLLPVGQRDAPQTCQCGEPMQRVATAVNFRMAGGNPKIDYEHAFNTDALGKDIADAIKRRDSGVKA
jgi:putative FmdB family regulatory protein